MIYCLFITLNTISKPKKLLLFQTVTKFFEHCFHLGTVKRVKCEINCLIHPAEKYGNRSKNARYMILTFINKFSFTGLG